MLLTTYIPSSFKIFAFKPSETILDHLSISLRKVRAIKLQVDCSEQIKRNSVRGIWAQYRGLLLEKTLLKITNRSNVD